MSLEELMDVEVVFAGSRREENPRQIPFPVFVISRDEIRQHGWSILGEVLQQVPGFYVTNDRNYRYVGVRGFGRMGGYNSHVLVLVDGMRVNDNLFDYVGVGGDFVVDMDLVERVEVVVSPSAALYGNSAFFAVVNVVTRRGRDLSGGEVAAAAASFGGLGSRATYGRRLDNGLELLASASVADSPGPSLYLAEFDRPETNHGLTEGTDDEGYHRAFARLAWRGLSLQASHAHREKGVPTGAFGTLFGDSRNRTRDQATQVTLSGDRRVGDCGSVGLAINYGRVGYDGDYVFAERSSVVNRDVARGEWWRLEGSLRVAASVRHTVTVGGEFQDDLHQDQLNWDLQPAAVHLDLHADGDRWAAYAQDQVTLAGGLALNAGLRYDRYRSFGGATSPRVGLVFRHGSAFTAKALYGRAFRAPNEYELRYTMEDQGVPQRGNPDLRAETIDTAELVLERRLCPSLLAVASVYHSDVRQLIAVTRDPDEGFLMFRNSKGVRSTGFRAGLELKRGRTTGRASYAFQRTTLAGGGDERLVDAPSHLARASLAFPLSGRFSAGVDASYMSSRRTLAGRETSSVLLANATLLARRLPGRLEAAASVYNLLDRRYADPGAEEHVQDLIFQDGRTFRLKLLWRF
jgi:iron complex outermembrane receptor protein